MKNFRYIFPNALTATNLLLGSLAIIIVFRGQNEYNAAWLIFAASILDLLDGMVARAIDARSEFGKNLDSLADLVCFGIAPSMILFNWLILILTRISESSTFELVSASLWQNLVLLCSLFFGVAAALRLAKFNITVQKSSEFKGLPTPAAAIIVASLWLILGSSESELAQNLLLNIYVVLAGILILIILMLSNLKMLSLKFRGLGFTENFYPYLLLILGIVLVVLFWIEGIFLAMMAYLILSLVYNIIEYSKKRE